VSAIRQQLTRDLLWVVNSQPFCEGSLTAPNIALQATDIDADALVHFMQSRGEHRVGRHFEHLLHYWLAEIRHVNLVGQGLQVRDGKRTIGEVDFLYRDERNVLVHCEASVKFFLHHPRPGTSHFPGPNASDNYERKMTKLFDQQLALSANHFPDVQERHGLVRGTVFYHPDVPAPSVLPERMPANHTRGMWLRQTELARLPDSGCVAGQIAHKPHWLASAGAEHAVAVDELIGQIDTHFQAKDHPLMVCLFREDRSEAERLFVVPARWPQPRT